MEKLDVLELMDVKGGATVDIHCSGASAVTCSGSGGVVTSQNPTTSSDDKIKNEGGN